MFTEKDISKQLGRKVASPVRVGSLADLGLNTTAFLTSVRPFFEHLQDDVYLVRSKQVSFLQATFSEDKEAIERLHQAFFEGRSTLAVFDQWTQQLTGTQKQAFEELAVVTRQRSIATFRVEIWDDTFFIERVEQEGFAQDVTDHRVWKRVFQQTDAALIAQQGFGDLIKKIAQLVREIHPSVRVLELTSHLMRTIAQQQVKGENAPEGIHEDGAQYIMSALVINRHNIVGAESQVYEKMTADQNQLIYAKELAAGEFIFQADTGEEFTFGNDLWHYVTPIAPKDPTQLGYRDIIGFDIDLL